MARSVLQYVQVGRKHFALGIFNIRSILSYISASVNYSEYTYSIVYILQLDGVEMTG